MTNIGLYIFLVFIIANSIKCEEYNNCSKTNPRKLILFWTTFYGHSDFEFGTGTTPFEEHKCKVQSCETTFDRLRLKDADVIVFHLRNMRGMEDIPMVRSSHQIYLFFLLEHPENQWNPMKQYEGFFNATMTYLADSTIPIPYGLKIPILDGVTNAQVKPSNHLNKTSLVAWFVSNCNSPGGRHYYYDALKNYINIDVYGKCGNLKCPEHPNRADVRMDVDCYGMLSKRYKFYLSFESHHCKHYITEKFWNILRLTDNVIPVVLGGGDYVTVSPPHSYIDASKYTPKSLSELLKRLALNEKEFNAYFEWKTKWKIIGQVENMRRGFCNLCEIINNQYYNWQPIYNLTEWWTHKSCDRTVFPKLAKQC